jgi:hypothetical protein
MSASRCKCTEVVKRVQPSRMVVHINGSTLADGFGMIHSSLNLSWNMVLRTTPASARTLPLAFLGPSAGGTKCSAHLNQHPSSPPHHHCDVPASVSPRRRFGRSLQDAELSMVAIVLKTGSVHRLNHKKSESETSAVC